LGGEEDEGCEHEDMTQELPTEKIVKAFCRKFGFEENEVELDEVEHEKLELTGEGLEKRLLRSYGMIRNTLTIMVKAEKPDMAALQLRSEKHGHSKTFGKFEVDLEKLCREPERVLKEYFGQIKEQ